MVWYPIATGFWIDGIRHMFGIKCQGAGSHWVPILTLVFREFRDKKVFQMTRQAVAFMVMFRT